MRHGIEEVVGHGQPHDVERLVTADQHHAAQHRRPHVVGMGRAADQRLAHHGELHKLLAREGAVEQFIEPVDGGGRRGRTRPDAAAGSDLFEHRDLDPHRTAVCRKHGPQGGRNDVFFDIFGKIHPAQVADLQSFGALLGADLQQIADAVERQPHHVEPAAQIRHRSGGENSDMFHN